MDNKDSQDNNAAEAAGQPLINITPTTTAPVQPPMPEGGVTNSIPQPSPSPQFYTASQSGWNPNQKVGRFNGRKFALQIVAILLALGVLTFGILFLANIVPLTRFQTVTYDNGEGGRYNLKFYRNHKISKVSDNLPTPMPQEGAQQNNLKNLVSKVSNKNKAPLAVWVATVNGLAGTTLYKSNDCSANSGIEKVFDVKVEHINSNVAVCVIKPQDIELFYIATFHNQDKGYLVFFSQDIEYDKIISSPQSVAEYDNKIGLEVYRDDIKTILGSIKPN